MLPWFLALGGDGGTLNPAEVGEMLGVAESADAFDAALITGGLPLICAEWLNGAGIWDFLRTALSDPVSALLVSAERSLSAEFPQQAQARTVLSAIGSGERTFSNIARAAGGIGATPLQRALGLLTGKRVIAAELPLSTRPSKDRRYRVADPYLRFWLKLLGPAMGEIERGRGDLRRRLADLGEVAVRSVVERAVLEEVARGGGQDSGVEQSRGGPRLVQRCLAIEGAMCLATRCVWTTQKPQVIDLGLGNGADGGNRTRALSLGITGSFSAYVLVGRLTHRPAPRVHVPSAGRECPRRTAGPGAEVAPVAPCSP